MRNYVIRTYNPLENSEKENEWFSSECKRLFSQRYNLTYMTISGLAFSEEQFLAWNKEFDPEKKQYLLIEDRRVIIAFAIILKDRLKNFKLEGLVVDEDYRRKGNAGLLIEKSFEIAKELGFRSVETEVYADNKPMLMNVISKGFKPVRINYHKRFDGEDIVVFKKYF